MEKFTVKNLRSIAKRNNLGGYFKTSKVWTDCLSENEPPKKSWRRNHGQNHKPWRHSGNKKFAWWWHSWTESTTATTNKNIFHHFHHHHREGKDSEKNWKDGVIVVTICSRAREKTNQQRFQCFQEKSYEHVSETIKVWGK